MINSIENVTGLLRYGDVVKGCMACMKGCKRTVHITYRCTKHCLGCPIPTAKFGYDKLEYEDKIYEPEDLQVVVDRIVSSKGIQGISISGGEPLLVFDRVKDLLAEIRTHIGSDFHIHLYTNGELLTEKIINDLSTLGLDEIRIDSLEWEIFEKLKNAPFDVVCETPCVPSDRYYEEMVNLINKSETLNLKYINLNEFEVTKENIDYVRKMGFVYKDNKLSKSREYAKKIINYAKKRNIPVNIFFCSFEIAEKIRISRNRI